MNTDSKFTESRKASVGPCISQSWCHVGNGDRARRPETTRRGDARASRAPRQNKNGNEKASTATRPHATRSPFHSFYQSTPHGPEKKKKLVDDIGLYEFFSVFHQQPSPRDRKSLMTESDRRVMDDVVRISS